MPRPIRIRVSPIRRNSEQSTTPGSDTFGVHPFASAGHKTLWSRTQKEQHLRENVARVTKLRNLMARPGVAAQEALKGPLWVCSVHSHPREYPKRFADITELTA